MQLCSSSFRNPTSSIFYFFLITIAKQRSHWHTSIHIAPHSRRTWHLTSIQRLFHFSFSTCSSWDTPPDVPRAGDRSILAPSLHLRSKACPWLSRSKTRAGCPMLTPAGLKPQQTPKPDQKLHTWTKTNGQSRPSGSNSPPTYRTPHLPTPLHGVCCQK